MHTYMLLSAACRSLRGKIARRERRARRSDISENIHRLVNRHPSVELLLSPQHHLRDYWGRDEHYCHLLLTLRATLCRAGTFFFNEAYTKGEQLFVSVYVSVRTFADKTRVEEVQPPYVHTSRIDYQRGMIARNVFSRLVDCIPR